MKMEHIDYIINTDTTKVLVIRNWLTHKYAKELHDYFNNKVNWVTKQKNYKNRMVPLKRSISIYGDGTLETYPYNKLPYTIDNWNNNMCVCKEIKQIKDKLSNSITLRDKLSTMTINTCIINKYDNGFEKIDAHSDDETIPYTSVITLSLGASRSFVFEHKVSKEIIKTILHNGDVLIMSGQCQQEYTHAIPMDKYVKESRISLTFRQV